MLCTPKKPRVLLIIIIIIPTFYGFIGGIAHFQTYPHMPAKSFSLILHPCRPPRCSKTCHTALDGTVMKSRFDNMKTIEISEMHHFSIFSIFFPYFSQWNHPEILRSQAQLGDLELLRLLLRAGADPAMRTSEGCALEKWVGWKGKGPEFVSEVGEQKLQCEAPVRYLSWCT